MAVTEGDTTAEVVGHGKAEEKPTEEAPAEAPAKGSEAGEAAAPAPAEPDPAVSVAQAESLKEAGTASLKASDLAEAAAKYLEALKLTEPVLEKSDLDEDVKKRCLALHIALNLNASLTFLKLENWFEASEHADRVLVKEPENSKALYRRAAANRNFETEGRLEQAVADLTKVAKLEPKMASHRKELEEVKVKYKAVKEERKRRMSEGLSGGLYKEQHAKHDRQKMQYEEEVVRRKEAGEDEIAFDAWQKKQKEDEEARQKNAKEQREKAVEKSRWEEDNEVRKAEGLEERTMEDWKKAMKTGKGPEKVNEVVTDLEMDEEEAKILAEQKKKGYYHGRLGTVLSAEAPKPQKLDGDASPEPDGGKVERVGSAWDPSGTTWQESDQSAWVKERLTACLKEAAVPEEDVTLPDGAVFRFSACVTSVKSLTGEAQIVTVSNRKTYGYNLEAELNFELSTQDAAGEKKKKYAGSLGIAELMDGVAVEKLEIRASWKKVPLEAARGCAEDWIEKLRAAVREKVAQFLAEYKQRN